MEQNYKIIGGDGREYGPVTMAELKAWVRDGRVAALTQVWRSDLASWSPASQYAELQAELGQTPAPPLLTTGEGPEPVGFWARLGAYIIDCILLYVAMSILTLPWKGQLAGLEKDLTASTLQGDPEKLLGVLVGILIYCMIYSLGSMSYFVVMNGKFGATVGKMAVGAKIVNLDGSPLGYQRAIWRYMAEMVSWLILGIGYLMIAFRSDKRGLHDLLAHTRVIYKR